MLRGRCGRSCVGDGVGGRSLGWILKKIGGGTRRGRCSRRRRRRGDCGCLRRVDELLLLLNSGHVHVGGRPGRWLFVQVRCRRS